MQDELSMQAAFRILQTCLQYEWMLDVIDIDDIYNSLEPFLSRSDEIHLRTLFVLYPLLPKLSDKQINLMLLTQSDVRNLTQKLRNIHTFCDTLQFLTYALTLIHNAKILFENGFAELLAEFLEDPSITQGDQEVIAQLIENLISVDFNISGGGKLSVSDNEQVADTKLGESTSSFIRSLEGKYNVFARPRMHEQQVSNDHKDTRHTHHIEHAQISTKIKR